MRRLKYSGVMLSFLGLELTYRLLHTIDDRRNFFNQTPVKEPSLNALVRHCREKSSLLGMVPEFRYQSEKSDQILAHFKSGIGAGSNLIKGTKPLKVVPKEVKLQPLTNEVRAKTKGQPREVYVGGPPAAMSVIASLLREKSNVLYADIGAGHDYPNSNWQPIYRDSARHCEGPWTERPL